jgi:hypothetical protein
MILHYFIAGAACCGIFILFLVLSRTLNALVNHLVKLHYLLQKEYEMKKELVEINRLLQDDAPKADGAQESEATGPEGETAALRQ